MDFNTESEQIVCLYYVAEPVYGGWPSFTAHLYYALKTMGYKPQVYRIGQRTEPKQRVFGQLFPYQNLHKDHAIALCEQYPSIITAFDGKAHMDAVVSLLGRKAILVVHDPTELRSPLLTAVHRSDTSRVVVIREGNKDVLAQHGIAARFIPHPYVRLNVPGKPLSSRYYNAISQSRLDWDKHTELILQANLVLPVDKQVQLFGAENRRYGALKLSLVTPTWKRWWNGTFPRTFHSGTKLCLQSSYVIDMSSIKHDGGGTQYTFLEAWDAGCVLVVNKEWVRLPGVVSDHAVAVDGAGLANVLKQPATVFSNTLEGMDEVFAVHAPSNVVPQYMSTAQY